VKQNGLTVLADIRSGHEQEAGQLLDLINRDPARNALIDFSRIASIHFASWVILPAYSSPGARLMLETNYDGDLESHLDDLIEHGAKALDRIYAHCEGYPAGGARNRERVKRFLKAHSIKSSAFYAGMPGRSVGDIRDAMAVARKARDYIDARAASSASNPGGEDAGFERLDARQVGAELAHHFRRKGMIRPMRSPVNRRKLRVRFWLHAAALAIAAALTWPILLIAAPAILIVARMLELREQRERPPDPAMHPAADQADSGQESATQNHMCTVTEIKPGLARLYLLKGALAAANLASRWFFIFGKLGPVPTIHFARWALIDGNRRLLFLSNYDGIWSSYLGDFADQGWGVTGIWSNTIGFPRTKFLFWGGARDVNAFERNVREHLIPARVFYRAYPGYASQTMLRDLDFRDRLAAAITASDRIEALAQRVDLDRADVQGILASGYEHLNHARFAVMRVRDGELARAWLRGVVGEVATAARRGDSDPKPGNRFNLAFTASGLAALKVPPETLADFSEEFRGGMTRPGAAAMLGDTGASAPANWQFGAGENQCDILLLLYGRTPADLAALAARVSDPAIANGALGLIHAEDSDRADSREPFGFRDGISQPPVIGLAHKPPWRHQELIKTGEFLLGHENEYGIVPPVPSIGGEFDPHGYLRPDREHPHRKAFGLNGSYLAMRKLAQDVAGFREFTENHSRDSAGRADPYKRELLAAKMMGRWPSGAPLALAPEHDVPALGKSSALNNSFLYRSGDPIGTACPVGSHIRRANPRDALDASPKRSFELSKRHRIIRRGRKFDGGAPAGAGAEMREQGIVFIALNADIRRQFEFLQQAWINDPAFMGLHCDKDAIAGDNDGRGGFTIQGAAFDRHLRGLPRFVTVRGGAYFFVPSIAALKCVAGFPREPAQTAAGASPS
jgi:Dyp-type peroxidase family